jgi:polysaccharide pyruvyl transferase CsaB
MPGYPGCITTIGVIGSYGGLNQGDEAILTSMLDSLRQRLPDLRLTVFSRDVPHTRAHYDVDTVVPMRRTTRDEALGHVESLDLLLLGGGGILYDGEARHYLREVRLAQGLGVPTMAYAVGAGPLTFAEDQRLVRESLQEMRAVTVRDTGAKRLLEHVGVECPVDVTADPALLLSREPFPLQRLWGEGIPAGRRLVGMSIREPSRATPDLDADGYLSVLAHTADFVADLHDCEIVFIPMEEGDIRLSHGVIAGMVRASRAHVLRGGYRPAELLGLMEHLDLVIAMRLHVLIFATLAGTPLFPLPYSPKVEEFLAAIDVPSPPPVSRESLGTLLAAVERVWRAGQQDAGPSRSRIASLRQQAQRTLDIALGCLASNRGSWANTATTPDLPRVRSLGLRLDR